MPKNGGRWDLEWIEAASCWTAASSLPLGRRTSFNALNGQAAIGEKWQTEMMTVVAWIKERQERNRRKRAKGVGIECWSQKKGSRRGLRIDPLGGIHIQTKASLKFSTGRARSLVSAH